MRRSTFLLSALLVATLTAASNAQALAGQWFKMSVTLDGTGNVEGETAKGQFKKLVRYVRFSSGTVDGNGPVYALSIYSTTTEGDWIETDVGTIEMLDAAETYVRTAEIQLPTAPVTPPDGSPSIASVQFNGPVKIKMNGDEVKSAKITSVGSIAYFTNESDSFHGRAKITMTRVGLDKLPFEVATALQKPQPEAPVAEAKAEKP